MEPIQTKPILLTVNLLTYNSSPDLERFFTSLQQQTYKDFKVIVIDNASNDESVSQSARLWPTALIHKNSDNLGYTGGHNVGLGLVDTEYVLIANPDVMLAETFIEHLFADISQNQRLGSVGGKILRLTNTLNNNNDYVIIDSTGLVVHRNRRFVDRGQGETDHGQYDADGNIFGISGALVMYRMSALRQVRLTNGQYFDERYFMYREDIDLAWRLQHFGWSARYNHTAVAWHRRTAAGIDGSNDRLTANNRSKKSPQVNYWSYRNHLYTLLKNERAIDFWRDGLWIIWYEFKKLVYLIFMERSSLIALSNIWHERKMIRTDRRKIQMQGRCNMANWQT